MARKLNSNAASATASPASATVNPARLRVAQRDRVVGPGYVMCDV